MYDHTFRLEDTAYMGQHETHRQNFEPKPLSDFTHVEYRFLGGILTRPSHFLRSKHYNDGRTISFYFKSIKVRFLSRPCKGAWTKNFSATEVKTFMSIVSVTS